MAGIGKYKGKGNFTMSGSSFYGKKISYGSPLNKNGQVPLSKHEKKKGTVITGGSKSEEINDAEDRIEFLNQDLESEKNILKRGKIITQKNKLKNDLKKRSMRKSNSSIQDHNKTKKNKGFNFKNKGNFNFSKTNDYSKKNLDHKKYSDLEKYDDDK